MNRPSPVTIVDVILLAVPFSDALVTWVQTHPSFKAGLKFSNQTSFLPLGVVFPTRSPKKYEDEVIGFLVWDKVKKKFKQDFIVNVGGENKSFILYTKNPGHQDTTETKHIKQFFQAYDYDRDTNGIGFYGRSHHMSLAQIDGIAKKIGRPWLSEMARDMIIIGESITATPTQQELDRVYDLILETRRNGQLTDPRQYNIGIN